MKVLKSIGAWVFGILFWGWVAITIVETIRGMYFLGGVWCALVGVITLPFSAGLFPMYLVVAYGEWSMVIGTYIILPILGKLWTLCVDME